jgi:hypothetical protein
VQWRYFCCYGARKTIKIIVKSYHSTQFRVSSFHFTSPKYLQGSVLFTYFSHVRYNIPCNIFQTSFSKTNFAFVCCFFFPCCMSYESRSLPFRYLFIFRAATLPAICHTQTCECSYLQDRLRWYGLVAEVPPFLTVNAENVSSCNVGLYSHKFCKIRLLLLAINEHQDNIMYLEL